MTSLQIITNKTSQFLHNQIFKYPGLPDLDKFNDRLQDMVESETVLQAQQAINALTKKISQTVIKRLIYDEAKFINFIKFCEAQNWITPQEAEICLNDLNKESPQEFLTLFTKTEAIAAPGWMIPALYEFLLSGDNNVAIVYAFGSIIRASGSYYLSEGVVEHRKLLAAGEAIPHIGRASLFVMLAEEHPELARMLWAYRSCRKFPEKAEKQNFELDAAYKKFKRSHRSPVLDFLIEPGQKTREWIASNPVLDFSLRAAQVLGLK